jgi:hypothetical protein
MKLPRFSIKRLLIFTAVAAALFYCAFVLPRVRAERRGEFFVNDCEVGLGEVSEGKAKSNYSYELVPRSITDIFLCRQKFICHAEMPMAETFCWISHCESAAYPFWLNEGKPYMEERVYGAVEKRDN